MDLGEDEFTQGRLHPMIDPALRNRRIVQAARDPSTAVILLDYVLGYGSTSRSRGARAWTPYVKPNVSPLRTGGRSSSSHRSAAPRPTHSG